MIDGNIAKSFLVAGFIYLGANLNAFASVSGAYFSESESALEMIHLVELEDGKVVGRLEIYSIDKSGDANVMVQDLEGAADGDELILIVPGGFADTDHKLSISGKVDDDMLHLIWLADGNSYRRSDITQRNNRIERIFSGGFSE